MLSGSWKASRYRTLISHAFLSVFTILYTVTTLTILRLQIYPTVKRVTYFDATVNWSATGVLALDILVISLIFAVGIILAFRVRLAIPLAAVVVISASLMAAGNEQVQQITPVIFLLSLPALAGITVADKIQRNERSELRWEADRRKLVGFTSIFLIIFVALEVVVLPRWADYPFILEEPAANWSWTLNSIFFNLVYAFGLLSPYLILLSMAAFSFRRYVIQSLVFLIRWFERRLLVQDKHSESNSVRTYSFTKYWSPGKVNQKFVGLTLLVIGALLPSVLLPLYSYYSSSEPDNYFGTDIPIYSQRLSELGSHADDPQTFFYEAFIGLDGGSRSLSYLTLYALAEISGQDAIGILRMVPTLLGPALVLAAFYFVKVAYPDNKGLPFVAAIATAFSHQVVLGFYAAFYANWMALIAMLFALAFLIHSTRAPAISTRNLLLYSAFAILVLFFHSYAWSYLVAVIGLFLGWSAIKNRHQKASLKAILLLGAITSAIMALDVVKSSYAGGSTSFESDLVLAGSTIGVEEFATRWINLNAAFRLYLGGFLTNSAILVLLLVWTFKANYSSNSDRILLSFLFIGFLPILFADYIVQARILYMIPFQIPASIMLYKIYQNKTIVVGKPLFFALLLMHVNYAVYAMANMQFILP